MTRSRETGDVGYRAYKKNYLINGGFDIWQRGEVFNTVGYTVDRWYIPANTNLAKSAFLPPNSGASNSILNSGVAGNRPSIYQGIELPEVGTAGAFYAGRQFTISFMLYVTEAGENIDIRLQFVDAVGSATNAVVIVPETTIGTSEGAVWQYVEYTVTLGSGTISPTNTALEFYLRNGAIDASASITNLQLEEGSSATSFEYVSPQENLAACQRYYWQGLASGGGFGHLYGTAGLTGMQGIILDFPVAMRTEPAVNIVTAPLLVNCSGLTLAAASRENTVGQVTVTATDKYRAINGTYEADAEL